MTINQAFTILANAGGLRAARILTENTSKLTRFRVWYMARMLRRGVPVAKIVGNKWFYGLRFYTNKYTLDPRPDTETLVEAILMDWANCGKTPKILDLGTGTGCVLVSLVKNIDGASGVGLDVSRRVLKVAKKNVMYHNLLGRICLKRNSFYNSRLRFGELFDVIVSNPPYIANGDLRVDVGAKHDPELALYADDGGFAAYYAIAEHAKNWIRDGGKIYLEIGIGMGQQVKKIFQDMGWEYVRSEKDLGEVERVLVFAKL